MTGSRFAGGRYALRAPARRLAAGAALVAGLVLPALGVATPAAHAETRPSIQPLPANLEAVRVDEAVRLYGSPGIRPIEQRKSALIAMGDSEMSGEGVGNYEPGTHQDGNWCDRSIDQAIWRVAIASAEPPVRRTAPVERAQPGRRARDPRAQRPCQADLGDRRCER